MYRTSASFLSAPVCTRSCWLLGPDAGLSIVSLWRRFTKTKICLQFIFPEGFGFPPRLAQKEKKKQSTWSAGAVAVMVFPLFRLCPVAVKSSEGVRRPGRSLINRTAGFQQTTPFGHSVNRPPTPLRLLSRCVVKFLEGDKDRIHHHPALHR